MDIQPTPTGGAPQPTPQQTVPPGSLPPIQQPEPRQGQSGDGGHLKSILSTVLLFATAFSIAILLNTFIIQSYQVDGQSMENTLQNNDRLIVNKVPRTLSRITGHQYVPGRADIIIFNQAGLPGFVGEKQLIKRVIGLPGERVVVNNGQVTVYNTQHPLGFNPDAAGTYKIASATTVGNVDVTLQKDEIFVSGDNRPNSEDSRYFGPVKTNQIVAKLVLRILPLNHVEVY
ncbi:signal peptidase I [Candidatus Saccharibacteria bacterium]|nr:signal peptidase I [Candidatus Saccharibacteria bacterium]